MSYQLQGWSVKKHAATKNNPAYAHVTIRGIKKGLFKSMRKSEAYDIPLDSNAWKNSNEALVKRAIKLSASSWSIPWGMPFR